MIQINCIDPESDSARTALAPWCPGCADITWVEMRRKIQMDDLFNDVQHSCRRSIEPVPWPQGFTAAG